MLNNNKKKCSQCTHTLQIEMKTNKSFTHPVRRMIPMNWHKKRNTEKIRWLMIHYRRTCVYLHIYIYIDDDLDDVSSACFMRCQSLAVCFWFYLFIINRLLFHFNEWDLINQWKWDDEEEDRLMMPFFSCVSFHIHNF